MLIKFLLIPAARGAETNQATLWDRSKKKIGVHPHSIRMEAEQAMSGKIRETFPGKSHS